MYTFNNYKSKIFVLLRKKKPECFELLALFRRQNKEKHSQARKIITVHRLFLLTITITQYAELVDFRLKYVYIKICCC